MKILFLLGNYYPEISANASIGQMVMEIMENSENQIYCLTKNISRLPKYEIYNKIKIIRIRETKFTQLFEKMKTNNSKIVLRILALVRKAFLFPFIKKFPNIEIFMSKKMLKTAIELHNEKNFDCVIGIFRPFVTINTAIELKKIFPDLVVGAYYLDLISGQNTPFLLTRKQFDKLCQVGENKYLKKLDFLFMPIAGKEEYSKEKYSEFNEKIKYIDFPTFVFNGSTDKKQKKNGKIIFTYAGTMEKKYRNPYVMLDTFKKIKDQIGDFEIHLYGKFYECQDIIDEFISKEKLKIICYGFVSKEKINEAYKTADFIINIANSSKNMVPSKIFEMFATRKPVISFFSDKFDYTIKYFQRYPLAFKHELWKNEKKQLNELKKFIFESKGIYCEKSVISDLFKENTPEYVANEIEKKIKEFL